MPFTECWPHLCRASAGTSLRPWLQPTSPPTPAQPALAGLLHQRIHPYAPIRSPTLFMLLALDSQRFGSLPTAQRLSPSHETGLFSETRDDSSGSAHVQAVVLAEVIEHHPFFSRNAKEV